MPPKTERKHIPALHPDTLKLLLQDIDALKIGAKAKQQLKDMLNAAANPDNEKVDVIIRTMTKQEQANVKATAAAVANLTAATVARGSLALQTMTDDEWDAILDDDN